MPRSAGLTASIDDIGRMLTRLGLGLERLSDIDADTALHRVRSVLADEIARIDSATSSVTLADLPADAMQEFLRRMDYRSLSRAALSSTELAAHVRALMHSTDWGLHKSFARRRENEGARAWQCRYEHEVELLIAVTCRLSPVQFTKCIKRIGAMAAEPPPSSFWRAIGLAASKGLARTQWTEEALDERSFRIQVCTPLLSYLEDEDDADLPPHATTTTPGDWLHLDEEERWAIAQPRSHAHRCCVCTVKCCGWHRCRAPPPTERHVEIQKIAHSLIDLTAPALEAGLLTRAELLTDIGHKLPPALRAFFLGCYLVGDEGPQDEDEWAEWGGWIAELHLPIEDLVELARVLANFDANHYDEYDRYSVVSCRNVCVLLDAWADETNFPDGWELREQRLMHSLMHEVPWKLHESVPPGFCPWLADLPPPSKPRRRPRRRKGKAASKPKERNATPRAGAPPPADPHQDAVETQEQVAMR